VKICLRALSKQLSSKMRRDEVMEDIRKSRERVDTEEKCI
jgi:hypothetical protein